MGRFWTCLALLFVIGAPLWYGPIIYNDLTCPELWSDWKHDPRWYGPLLLLSMAATVALFTAAIREQRRWDRMIAEERYEEAVRRLSKGRRR